MYAQRRVELIMSVAKQNVIARDTAKPLYSKAQGREAHPGLAKPRAEYAEGVTQKVTCPTLSNAFGVMLVLDYRPRVRGCAATLGSGVKPLRGNSHFTPIQIASRMAPLMSIKLSGTRFYQTLTNLACCFPRATLGRHIVAVTVLPRRRRR